MTNFKNSKPYINDKIIPPAKIYTDKIKAVEDAIKIIKENKKIIEKARLSSHENLHR